jgi:hypothetical protein
MSGRIDRERDKETIMRILSLFVLWLGISVGAQAGSGAAAGPGSFFLGGCGLILVTMVRLSWKIRKTIK